MEWVWTTTKRSRSLQGIERESIHSSSINVSLTDHLFRELRSVMSCPLNLHTRRPSKDDTRCSSTTGLAGCMHQSHHSPCSFFSRRGLSIVREERVCHYSRSTLPIDCPVVSLIGIPSSSQPSSSLSYYTHTTLVQQVKSTR